ncbi:hypothetical protein ccbrp13_65490 [Ktedonobacteria bacterium brp13]|nr:hypothetical protein ccbrp13_65490 [Ktedonobacteria bacterium brp13]
MVFPKFVLSALYRRQITAFLGMPYSVRMRKVELIEYLYSLLQFNERFSVLLLEAYPYELAVGPTEAQQILQCTTVERKRWIQEERLPVFYYRTLLPTGISYPVHDRQTIMGIATDELEQWREEHRQEVHQHRVAAAHERARAVAVIEKVEKVATQMEIAAKVPCVGSRVNVCFVGRAPIFRDKRLAQAARRAQVGETLRQLSLLYNQSER